MYAGGVSPFHKLSAEEEAAQLLEMRGSLTACLDLLSQQFNIIQTRSQLLLTLSTLTLTITGFSGPQIARAGAFARLALCIGLALVLLSTLVILLGSLRVRWVTQVRADTPERTLVAMVEYRNWKTRLYALEMALIVIGLACYVASELAYLS